MSRESAEKELRDFERRIRARARNWHPVQMINFAEARVRDAKEQVSKLVLFPPHHLAHAIEACCAYGTKDRNSLRTDAEFAAFIQILADAPDPVTTHALREKRDVMEFLLLMGRQQFAWQNASGALPFGRFARIFCTLDRNHPNGLSFPAILRSVFIVHAVGYRRFALDADPREALDYVKLAVGDLQDFIQKYSTTTHDLGVRYDRIRTDESPLRWRHLRYGLEVTPIIRREGRLVVPIPPYVLNLLAERVYFECAKSGDRELVDEIAERWEEYCVEVLCLHPSTRHVLSEQQLRSPTRKGCDAVFEADDYLLFVECKCIVLEREFATTTALHDPASSIAEGVVQLVESARRINDGEFGADKRAIKKRLGWICVMNAVPLLNTDSFWDIAILPKVREASVSNEELQELFETRPQIIDSEGLESAVLGAKKAGKSLPAMYRDKVGNPAERESDWKNFGIQYGGAELTEDLAYWRNWIEKWIPPIDETQRAALAESAATGDATSTPSN
ncbi:MAG: hypothetical protein KF696_12580 [Planctomycetes bacterium]|nr:hypothetical protein [Planctomycetota bacterium]MCW8135924.1 hypothetical protein [Planctomycetota bacterium]